MTQMESDFKGITDNKDRSKPDRRPHWVATGGNVDLADHGTQPVRILLLNEQMLRVSFVK